jgi:hypothetical protein
MMYSGLATAGDLPWRARSQGRTAFLTTLTEATMKAMPPHTGEA